MRDLLRKGVRAVGIDNVESTGFRSFYGKSYLCPDPDTHPGEWVAFMKDLAARLGQAPVFIPAADIFVSALGNHAAELAGWYLFSQDSVRIQAALATKEKQYALAQAHGLPCPRSVYIQSVEELREFAATAVFPCLLKPRHHREWEAIEPPNPLSGKKVVTADTPEQLLAHYAFTEGHHRGVMAQEIIVGGDDAKYCYLSVYGRNSVRLGYCVVREFRAYPIMFGSGSIVEPVVDEEIAVICDRFLRAIGYVGLCEIEVKRDARDHQVRLIEVNPRFSVTGDCASYTGVEVGWLHYLDQIGQDVASVAPTRLGFKHICLARDMGCFPNYLDEGVLTFGEWFKSYLGPVEYYEVDWRDPGVTAAHVYRSFRRLAGGLLRHWNLRKRIS